MSRKKAIRKLDEQTFSFVCKSFSGEESFRLFSRSTFLVYPPLLMQNMLAQRYRDTFQAKQANRLDIFASVIFVYSRYLSSAHIYATSMMEIVFNSCGFPGFFR
jgi:hypothetical protein